MAEVKLPDSGPVDSLWIYFQEWNVALRCFAFNKASVEGFTSLTQDCFRRLCHEWPWGRAGGPVLVRRRMVSRVSPSGTQHTGAL